MLLQHEGGEAGVCGAVLEQVTRLRVEVLRDPLEADGVGLLLLDLLLLLEDVLLLLQPEGGEAGDRGAVLGPVVRPVPDELKVPGVVHLVTVVLVVPAHDELVVPGVVRGAVLELVAPPVPDELEVPGVVHLHAAVLAVPAQVA